MCPQSLSYLKYFWVVVGGLSLVHGDGDPGVIESNRNIMDQVVDLFTDHCELGWILQQRLPERRHFEEGAGLVVTLVIYTDQQVGLALQVEVGSHMWVKIELHLGLFKIRFLTFKIYRVIF